MVLHFNMDVDVPSCWQPIVQDLVEDLRNGFNESFEKVREKYVKQTKIE